MAAAICGEEAVIELQCCSFEICEHVSRIIYVLWPAPTPSTGGIVEVLVALKCFELSEEIFSFVFWSSSVVS